MRTPHSLPFPALARTRSPGALVLSALVLGALLLVGGCSKPVPDTDSLPQTRRDLIQRLDGYRGLRPRLSGGFPHRPCLPALGSSLLCRPAPHTLFPFPVSTTTDGVLLPLESRHTEALAWIAGAATEQPTDSEGPATGSDDSLEIGIRMLNELLTTANATAEIESDLAAALLVRGEARESALDWVHAADLLETPSEGVAALFNRALACSTLVPGEFCEGRWRDASRAPAFEASDLETAETGSETGSATGWQREIQTHLAALHQPSPEARWQKARPVLLDAAGTGDLETVRELLEPYRLPVRELVQEDLLGNWGKAVLGGRPEEAALYLRQATIFAEALREISGDPLLSEVTTGLAAGTNPHWLRLLAQGHADYAAGMALDREGKQGGEALFAGAREAFRIADSPFQHWAELGMVLASLRNPKTFEFERLESLFANLLVEAEAKSYRTLEGRARWLRALNFQDAGRPLGMLKEYQASLGAYEAAGERESVTNVTARLADALAIMGAPSQSWELRYRALEGLPFLHEPERRHYVLGSTAIAAAHEGFVDTALLLQQAAIDEAHKAPRRINLPVALRALAEIHLARQETGTAEETLTLARQALGEGPRADQERSTIDSRIDEIAGDLLVATDPGRAAEMYRRAIDVLGEERAKHHRLPALELKLSKTYAASGARTEARTAARAHLDAAMALVQGQWQSIFVERQPGEHERELERYFQSSRDISEEQIRLLVEEGHPEEALGILEQVRGRELLALAGVFLGRPPEPMTARQLQRSLPPATNLVAYEVLEEQIIVWAVSAGSGADGGEAIRSQSIPLPRTELRALIQDLQEDFQGRAGGTQLRGSLQTLYRHLIRPLEPLAAGSTLVIVPDEELSRVPFSALLNPASDRYLIQDHAIALSPSGSLYAFSRQRDEALARGGPGTALLVANPVGTKAPLPLAEREVASLAEVYPAALVLVGAEATRDRFLAEVPHHDIIHYAGHTEVSVLALSPSPGGSSSISSGDILGQLPSPEAGSRTRLIVLSACTSLGSQGSAGLELSYFARPFLGRGVPALVGSLWDVNDGDSQALMLAFHRFLSTEADAAHALQKAQLEQLEAEVRPHASLRVWAAYQLVGFTSTRVHSHIREET